MNQDSRAGFTLIELLVVITILSLLIVAFAPDIFGALTRGEKAADQANLRFHYAQLEQYRAKYQGLPTKPGHKFVLASWIDGVCQKSEQNFSRFWTPGPTDQDPRFRELRETAKLDPKSLWRSYDEVDSEDTHYAGVSTEQLHSRTRLWTNADEPLIANDNEFGWIFQDGTMHVLMGDGSVKVFNLKDLQTLGFDGDAEQEYVEVGPQSTIELLRKLEH